MLNWIIENNFKFSNFIDSDNFLILLTSDKHEILLKWKKKESKFPKYKFYCLQAISRTSGRLSIDISPIQPTSMFFNSPFSFNIILNKFWRPQPFGNSSASWPNSSNKIIQVDYLWPHACFSTYYIGTTGEVYARFT